MIADPAGNLYGTTSEGGGVYNAGVIFKLDPSGHETVLHFFNGRPNTGGTPYAGVSRDAAGNLYGSASAGSGLIYKLDASGSYTVLYQFIGGSAPTKPEGELLLDSSGNVYGTTQYGGTANVGTVFELNTAGLIELYSFPGGGLTEPFPDAQNPGVLRDSAGNLYGVTAAAGVAGIVYKLDPARQETTLYSFVGATGGTNPSSGLVRDANGNFYGTTNAGGAANAGVLFSVDSAGRERVLYSFTDGADGGTPDGNVVRDSAGNLYGTTFYGGVASGSAGYGVVYKVDAAGNYSVLYSFKGGADGTNPKGGVVRDPAGNLYGTTLGGANGLGVVFKLDPAGRETVLHAFTGGADGGGPESGVTLDSAGNIYGTTFSGGSAGAGVVFKLDPLGQEIVLYSFSGFGAAGNPYAGVILDPGGNLYGTAVNGGLGYGVVYKVDAGGNYSVLYSFTGGADGGIPFAGVVRDSAGNLYGATSARSAVVYKLEPSGQFVVLYTFNGRKGAAATTFLLGKSNTIYGTGGAGALGGSFLFKLTLP